MEKDACTIDMWDKFKREIKRWFNLEDVAYLTMTNMKGLKDIGWIQEYLKEFSTLMLEIPNMTEELNIMDNLQSWVKQELRFIVSKTLP